MFQCFVIMLLKWMKYKNRLTFEYYSIRYWDFKRLQSVPKTWQMLKTFLKKLKKTLRNFFERCPITEIPFFYDFKSRFLIIFSNIYWHRLVLEMPFPHRIFPKISKYRSKNLPFPSPGKYYAPPLYRLLKSVFVVTRIAW